MNYTLKAYGRIQWLGIKRLWLSFPLLFKIGFLLFIPILLFGLYKINISDENWKSIVIISGIYLTIYNSLNPTKPERILIHNYKVPFRLISCLKATILTLPFFLIHWKTGCLCLFAGCILAISKPEKISAQKHLSKLKPVYPFKKSSFQWFSFYRQSGFYAHCISVLGIIMGIVHENPNLCLISLSLTGIIPGIFSQIQMEPLFFLKSYLNPNELVRQKTLETIYNISILQLPVCPFLLLSGINFKHIIQIFVYTIILSWINMALKYTHYPNSLAHLIISLITLAITILFMVAGSWLLLAIVGVILISAYAMKQNMNKTFNPIIE